MNDILPPSDTIRDASSCSGSHKYDFFRVVVILVGIGLAIAQFIFNRSLWYDDVRVALAIITKTPYQLLMPFDPVLLQSAPIGFLHVSKLFSLAVPNADYAFRIFPLLCFCASIILFAKICDYLIRHDAAKMAALALFALNPALLYFSSDCKQYSSDVLFTCMMLWLALKPFTSEKRRYIWLCVAGAIAIFFSNVIIFVMAGIGAYLFSKTFDGLRISTKRLPWVLAVGAIWLCAFGIYYALFSDKEMMAHMQQSWSTADPAFMLRQGSLKQNLLTLVRQGAGTVCTFFGFLPFIIFVTACVIGGTGLIAKRLDVKYASLLLLPMIAHFFASTLKMYPFAPRLLVYSIPLLLLLAALPMDWLCGLLRIHGKYVRVALCAIMPICALLFRLTEFPIQRYEIKTSLRFLESHVNPTEETVFIDGSAWYAFYYYMKTGFVSDRMLSVMINTPDYSSSPILCMGSDGCEPVKKLKGHVWVVFGYNDRINIIPKTKINAPLYRLFNNHASKSHTQGIRTKNEEQQVLDHLIESHNVKILDSFNTVGSSAYLFAFPEVNGSHE